SSVLSSAAHQCCPSCHQLVSPISATYQCPLVLPISDHHCCISLQHHQCLLINAHQCSLISCCLSMPPHQCPSMLPISAHQCSLINAHQ
ncbi:unnamed protein product, partial [Staurois parvus]